MDGDVGTLSKEVENEEEDLDKLETELDQMAAAILESRAILPDLLSSTMSSILAARCPSAAVPDPGPSDQGKRECEERVVEEKARLVKEKMGRNASEMCVVEEKARLVKEKMGRNASEMRVVVERLRECAARTEKLRSSSYFSACNGIYNSIHPAFKKRKIFH